MATTTAESELRKALRHVQEGRACVMRQQAVVGLLSDRGLGTEEAESLLHWFEEMQGEFEKRLREVLSARRQRTELGLAALKQTQTIGEHGTPPMSAGSLSKTSAPPQP